MVYPDSFFLQPCGYSLHAQEWDDSEKRHPASVRYDIWKGHDDGECHDKPPEQYVFLFHVYVDESR